MKLLYSTGEIINQKYRILDILGEGGIGITYLAEDLDSYEKLALKALSLRRVNDWKKIELFERESQILAQLNHPAIPRYIDYFQVETDKENSFYIAQQLAPGKSLAELIESGWNPNESEVKDIAIQILDILIYLHSFSPPIIHRDIKPENIIIEENGTIFLVDFGAVTDTYHNTVAAGSTVVGTFGYMAPEQFRGKAFPSTDLYGLGTTLLYLLTKKNPSDLPQKHLQIDFSSQINVSQNFSNWLNKLIEPVAEERFSDAEIALVVLQGKEAIDNYLTKRLRKPKHTSIRLHKFEEKLLHIDIPAGKFRNKYRFVIAIFSLATNVLFLLIFLVVFLSLILSALKIYYFSLTALSFMMGAISILFPVIIYTLTISKNLIVNPLSHIEYTLSKTENYYIFACQKSLFSLRYRNSQKRCSFDNKVLETILRKKISSIKFNLTVEEYRWLKSEIDNFIK